jgi:hypothetical protein
MRPALVGTSAGAQGDLVCAGGVAGRGAAFAPYSTINVNMHRSGIGYQSVMMTIQED